MLLFAPTTHRTIRHIWKYPLNAGGVNRKSSFVNSPEPVEKRKKEVGKAGMKPSKKRECQSLLAVALWSNLPYAMASDDHFVET
jgi:hypothetical protein